MVQITFLNGLLETRYSFFFKHFEVRDDKRQFFLTQLQSQELVSLSAQSYFLFLTKQAFSVASDDTVFETGPCSYFLPVLTKY